MRMIQAGGWRLGLLTCCAVLAAGARAVAGEPAVHVIYNFPAGGFARNVDNPFAIDANGNLYGETKYGGAYSKGAIFQLQPPATATGHWTEVILHSLQEGGSLTNSNFVLDAAGNLYGTTSWGGNIHANCVGSCGTIFRLSPPAPGATAWTYSTIFEFDGKNGGNPSSTITMDKSGHLFGTAPGNSRPGVAYELMPPASSSGKWTQRILQDFGHVLLYGLSLDAQSGVLYGATSNTIYSLTPSGGTNPAYQYAKIYRIPYACQNVFAPVTFAQGSVFGSTIAAHILSYVSGSTIKPPGAGCGKSFGTVFRLAPGAAGAPWTLTILHSFHGPPDGEGPFGNLFVGDSGSVYGVTPDGGTGRCDGSVGGESGCGVIFSLAPPATGGGAWTEEILLSFNGKSQGSHPYAGFLQAYSNQIFTASAFSGGAGRHGIRTAGGGSALVVHPHMTLRPSP